MSCLALPPESDACTCFSNQRVGAEPQRAAGTQDTDRQGDEARPQTTNNDTVSDTNLMDWSLFMDDFGWSNSEGIFMGLS